MTFYRVVCISGQTIYDAGLHQGRTAAEAIRKAKASYGKSAAGRKLMAALSLKWKVARPLSEVEV